MMCVQFRLNPSNSRVMALVKPYLLVSLRLNEPYTFLVCSILLKLKMIVCMDKEIPKLLIIHL